MITPEKSLRTTIEWRFRLPLDAREINDAVRLVENEVTEDYDDRFEVTSDGTYLIFSWEKSD